MDIRCTTCGEPWDTDTIHEIAHEEEVSYSEALDLFRKHGCTVLGARHNTTPDADAAHLSTLAFELMGDDIDGVAAMLDDAEALGL